MTGRKEERDDDRKRKSYRRERGRKEVTRRSKKSDRRERGRQERNDEMEAKSDGRERGKK